MTAMFFQLCLLATHRMSTVYKLLLSPLVHCRQAKEKQLRIWKGYQPTSSLSTAIPIKSKNFTAKVVEIVNADALVVKTPEGSFQKIFFSSLRPPKYVCSTYVCNSPG